MSGGVDSSVCAALSVYALGAERVLGLILPERESDPRSLTLAKSFAEQLGIRHAVEEITGILDAAGCYARRDEAIRRAAPEYGPEWKCKLELHGSELNGAQLHVTILVLRNPAGEELRCRLTAEDYRQVVAASSYKQRVRAMMTYYHADRLHYAVVGTPNRLEYDQGFFVKGGDGLADLKPIAHLYKSQVYAIADVLGVPREITERVPTSDTYPLAQSQEEFYFGLPVTLLDSLVSALNEGHPAPFVAATLGLTEDEVNRAWMHVSQKRDGARYLHAAPLLAQPVDILEVREAR
jgi:NAD+ synthase